MKLLFFGADTCKKCGVLLRDIKKKKIDKLASLIYIDAFDNNRQEICDEHAVDELPHIKIYDGNKLAYESIGNWDIRAIEDICTQEKPKKFNLSKTKKIS